MHREYEGTSVANTLGFDIYVATIRVDDVPDNCETKTKPIMVLICRPMHRAKASEDCSYICFCNANASVLDSYDYCFLADLVFCSNINHAINRRELYCILDQITENLSETFLITLYVLRHAPHEVWNSKTKFDLFCSR